jgi:polyhydroxybutyrate depolymerase
VVLYTIRGGGHTWPGGKPLPKLLFGATSRDIDATSEMWKFFRDRRVRAAPIGRVDTSAQQ